jgi:PAS domain S-box-containing protein
MSFLKNLPSAGFIREFFRQSREEKCDMRLFPFRMCAIFGSALLALTAGGGWWYRAQERQLRGQANDGLTAIARLKMNQLATWRSGQLAEADELMASISFVKSVAQWLGKTGTAVPEDILSCFIGLQRHYQYHDVLLVNMDGQVLISLSGVSGGGHVEIQPALVAALRDGKPLLTDLHTCKIYPTPHISVIAPLFIDKGNIKTPLGAVILVSTARQFLYPLMQSWPTLSKTAEVLVVRREGNEVLFLNNLRFRPEAALKLRIPLSRTDVPAVMAVLGKEGIVEGRDYRGIEVLSALAAIPDSPWFMVAKVDSAEALSEWRFRSALILALILGLAAFLGTAMFIVWQRKEKAHVRALYESEVARRASEERHGITLRSIGDAVIITDAEGRVELLNPVAEVLTGWKEEDARGNSLEQVFRIINEESHKPAENPVAQVLREGLVVGLGNHTILVAREGIERPIADSCALICDKQGGVTGAVLVFRDQSVERASQKYLSIQNALSQVFLTASDEDMYAEMIRVILDIMQSSQGFFGYINEEGSLVIPSMTPDVRDRCQVPDKSNVFPRHSWGNSSWPRAIREKKPNYSNQISEMTPRGHIEIRRHMNLPILFQGAAIGLLQVANKNTDYTQSDLCLLETISSIIAPVLDARLKRDRQEAARQQALMDLERSNKELEQFAYVVSHDLKEPLRTILSYTQLLAKRYGGRLDQDAYEFIQYVVDGTHRMQSLIQDLLSYARITTHGSSFITLDLNEALGDAMANLQTAITESAALVTNGELPAVNGDRTQLVQIFQNLIENGIKFRKPGERPHVHIAAERAGDDWIITVRDNGIGIAPKHFGRLFVIFQRLHGKQEYPGSGIGLAICQRIATRHGGTIWVESALGEGAAFRFTMKA